MRHQNKKYVKAWTPRGRTKEYHRLVSWGIVADRVKRHFDSAARRAKEQKWFENLYVLRDDDNRTVQLIFGVHPITKLDATDLEEGATLVISQSVLGSVIVLLYPFETHAVKRIKSRVIWGVFDGPEALSHGVLLKILDDFFTYSRVSSALFRSSLKDRWRVSWLEYRSRLIEGSSRGVRLWGGALGALVVGSALTAGIFISWLLDDKPVRQEPLAGLVALITGWIAFGVQVGRDAVDKTKAREEAERSDRAQDQKRKQTVETRGGIETL